MFVDRIKIYVKAGNGGNGCGVLQLRSLPLRSACWWWPASGLSLGGCFWPDLSDQQQQLPGAHSSQQALLDLMERSSGRIIFIRRTPPEDEDVIVMHDGRWSRCVIDER